MNKSDLIERMADQAGISKTAAGAALDAATEAIKGTLRKGGSVTLVGFGSFSVTKRAARTGRNPRTGDPVAIKASNAPKFTAGKSFKDALN
jgi:DNA-binding protein HU-beta